MTIIRRKLLSLLALGVLLYCNLNGVYAQCSLSLNLTGTGSCLGADTLNLGGASTVAQIKWQNGGSTVAAVVKPTGGTTVAGDSSGIGSIAVIHLANPIAVFVDGNGNIYAADKTNNRIQKWTVGATRGITVAGDSNGTSGTTPMLLNGPAGVYVDGSGNLYVSDEGNNRIQKFAAGSANGVTVAGDAAGSSGTTNMLLNNPIGIYIDATNHVYIADKGNHRIQKWTIGATYGSTVAGDSTGILGVTRDLLNTPTGVCVDGAGNIYIADFQNNRIQKWAAGAAYGSTVAGDSAGTYAVLRNRLFGPWGVWLDGSNNLYIADASNNRLQRWNAGATSGYTIAGDSNGVYGTSSVLLNFPTAVYVDASQNFYVADFNNNRIQKYYQTINTSYVPTTSGTYTAIVTTTNGCKDTTNAVIVNPNVLPSVIINATATALCSGSADTFSTIPTFGGSPSYRWHVNGATVATGSSYITSSLHNSDSVWVVMASTAACAVPASVASIKKYVSVTPSITPSVVVHPTRTQLCIGSADTFSLTPTAGGNNPAYKWYRNGNLVNITADYTTTALQNGDSVWVTMTSNAVCASPTTVPSVKTGIIVDTLPVPVIVQNGQQLSTGTFSGYQWLLNNQPILGDTQRTIVGSVLSCYRVLVANAHGCRDTSAKVCIPAGITDLETYPVSLYPNPTEGTIYIEAENLIDSHTIELIDYTGRLVYTKSILTATLHERVDIVDCAAGIYLLKIQDASGTIAVRKVVKE